MKYLIINWNVKDETLRYLKSDIEGLLEILLKFSKIYLKIIA